MLQKMVTEAVIHDFYGLQKLAGEKTIYGCALVTDSDFGSAFMSMNTVREAGDPTSYDWDIYSWEYTSDQLNNSKLPGVSKELWRLLLRSGDSLQDTVLPMFAQALKHLQQDVARTGCDTDTICFFITITDDDNSENIENMTARDINSGRTLNAFLTRP